VLQPSIHMSYLLAIIFIHHVETWKKFRLIIWLCYWNGEITISRCSPCMPRETNTVWDSYLLSHFLISTDIWLDFLEEASAHHRSLTSVRQRKHTSTAKSYGDIRNTIPVRAVISNTPARLSGDWNQLQLRQIWKNITGKKGPTWEMTDRFSSF
jgi:hypothetical protein